MLKGAVMHFRFEDLGVYAFLLLIWVGVPAYVIWKVRSRRTPGRMKAEPVESNLPRVRRERVEEIEAQYGTDYRGPGRKGEPLFAPGGVMFLVGFVLLTLLGIWFSDLFRPAGQWVGDAIRRSVN